MDNHSPKKMGKLKHTLTHIPRGALHYGKVTVCGLREDAVSNSDPHAACRFCQILTCSRLYVGGARLIFVFYNGYKFSERKSEGALLVEAPCGQNCLNRTFCDLSRKLLAGPEVITEMFSTKKKKSEI